MEGIRHDVAGETALSVVEMISDEFRSHLQERLAAFCFGAAQASEDAEYYSFEKTISEFLARYEKKPNATKLGMAGELIVHVLMPHTHPTLSSSAVFLNKEERSIKKGFDLTFHSADGKGIWYGEVKSGEVGPNQNADQKSATLLKIAANDIADKLGPGAQRSRWDSAIVDAGLTLESSHAKTAKALLRSDVGAATAGDAYTKNVVLGAAVMHELDHCQISQHGVVTAVSGLNTSGRFSSMYVLVIQQQEVEAVISFLREVIADD